ncbi:SusC/RagA family TonB-linked outer membrane protein [Saccharicrinis fermentans]|uniref:Outer membrane cobalamin receptor protein n=1 Tax=Saccharicrinis fermentans DSM 9555 = JCM 21142 TaxID=869213 RepID=W7YHZ8_9BACT|nr:TonB-dependent receptor [Saccharicrinis fermentans]GAF02184.1 outer membrane cobalamin receptor protein [Saccharicrinis fermentans DSM 9555 = JCM 21142]
MKRLIYNKIGLLTLLLLIPVFGFAQEKTIKGKITDETGYGVPGVSVVIQGTTNGTITNIEGEYVLNAIAGETLHVSFIGYKSQTVVVSASGSVYDFVLEEEFISLNEVVAIGYGKAQKKDLTSAISSVDGDALKTMSVGNPVSALQGKAAGIQVVSGSGAPGSAPKVLIRGFTSVTLGAEPLYVVDGVPMGTNINFLNANEIERMDVLKDASASAIYGSRGSNGVILITTKKGKDGKTNFSADLSYGVQVFEKPYEMADATEYAQIMNQSLLNVNLDARFDDPSSLGKGTDWWGEGVNKLSPQTNFSFQANGGSEKFRYAVSLSYFDQESFYNSGEWERFTGRISLDWTFSDKVKAGIMMNPRREKWDNTPSWYQDYLLIDPITPIYRPEAEQAGLNEYSIFQRSYYTYTWNPIARDARNFGNGGYYAAASNLYVTYEPIENLEIKSQINGDFKFNHADDFIPDFVIDGAHEWNAVNSVSRDYQFDKYWNWTNTATYTLKKDAHSLTTMVGATLEKWNYSNIEGSKENIPNNSELLRELDAATSNDKIYGNEWGNSIESFLGRVSYNFLNRYYLTGTYRIDGASKFLGDNKWGAFPSLSAAWRISDETFMRGFNFLDDMKIRMGWGRLGNQGLESGLFLSTLSTGYYVMGDDASVVNTTAPSLLANEDLKWETVEDINIGTDVTLFNSKATASVEYFQKKTIDMLFEMPYPYYSGYPNYSSIMSNIGSMKSSGWELALSYRDHIGELNFDVTLTAMTGQVEMTKLSNTAPVVYGTDEKTKTVVGDEPGYYFGYKTDGLFQNQYEVNSHSSDQGVLLQPYAQPGDIRFIDVNGDGELTGEDRTKIGSPWPDFTTGLNVSLSYKGFDFLANVYASIGNDLVNELKDDLYSTTASESNVKSGLLNTAWHGEGTSNSIPRVSHVDNNQNYTRFSDFYVEDGSFLRLKNLQLGYTIPQSLSEKAGLSRCRVYVSGQNLLTVTNYQGVEPEVGGNALNTGFGGWTYLCCQLIW